MAEDTLRSVSIERVAAGRYTVRNARGGSITIGSATEGDHFTPVELLLAAIGGRTAAEVDVAKSRHGEPGEVRVGGAGEQEAGLPGDWVGDLGGAFGVAVPGGGGSGRGRG